MKKPQPTAVLFLALGLQAVWTSGAFQETEAILPVRVGLEPIRMPALDDLEAVVRDQIEVSQTALQRLGAREDITAEGLAQAYGNIGRLYHAYDFDQAAESAYRNAYHLDPSKPEWLHLMGLLLEGQGRLTEAAAYYQETLRLAPQILAARIYLGRMELEQNRPLKAQEQFRTVLEADSDNAAAHVGMGQSKMALEEWSAARDHFQAALQVIPQAGRIHYSLGLALREMGQLEEARSHLAQRNSVGVAPADPIADSMKELKQGFVIYTIRGRSQFQNGLIAQAAVSFAQAVQAAPDDPGARVNLATALARLDRRAEALDEFRKALELDPDHASAHFNLGVLLINQDPPRSLQHFLETLKARPDDSEALRWAAHVAVRVEGQPQADQLALLAAQKSRADEMVVMRAAAALAQSGRAADALRLLEASESEHPGRGQVLEAWAFLLATAPAPELRDGEKALQMAQAVYSARRSIAHGRTVALALAESGDCQQAAVWASRMIRIAESSGQTALLGSLRQDLARFQQGPPCRFPLPAQDSSSDSTQPPKDR